MTKAEIERAIERIAKDADDAFESAGDPRLTKEETDELLQKDEDYEAALDALSEALKRVEGCDWCKTPKKSAEDYIDNDPEGYEKQMETSWIAWASIGELVKTVSSEYGISACNGTEQEVVVCKGMTICPYCGRWLGEEARDG